MPFTPFHMGPGLAVKALGGRHFSVLVFGIAQVAMDIEPGIGMLRGADVLHGWTHSYAGATVIGLLVLLLAPPLCRPILRRWNAELQHHRIGCCAHPGKSAGSPRRAAPSSAPTATSCWIASCMPT